MARIVLGVGGGIAAYKAASLLRLFTEAGHDVTVVPTRAALKFVGEPTWAALSGKPVSTEVWSDVHDVPHVRIGKQADLVVVAPATADLLARAACGAADDLLTNTLLTARCPVLYAPAMHTEMWEHPATQANVSTLTARGAHVMPPASGRLTGTDTGPGRLPEPEAIFAEAIGLLLPRDLEGVRVVVSAGGTREPLDPVRYLGNSSSGMQGAAIAADAASRGAAVTLVAANMSVPAPADVHVVEVGSAADLHEAMNDASRTADIVVMAAAVADFRPVTVGQHKIKKDDTGSAPVITLERTADVLADLVAQRSAGRVPDHAVIVGFAAETGDSEADWLEHGRRKFVRKGCDLLVVNDVSGGKVFSQPGNRVVILSQAAEGDSAPIEGSKAFVARAVVDAALAARQRRLLGSGDSGGGVPVAGPDAT